MIRLSLTTFGSLDARASRFYVGGSSKDLDYNFWEDWVTSSCIKTLILATGYLVDFPDSLTTRFVNQQ